MRLSPLVAVISISTSVLSGAPVAAEKLAIPPMPPIGTRTVATADLLVPRPDTRPCIIELLAKHEFEGEKPVPLSYAPPADCPGPWSKVVIEADFNVTKGRQFDRTAIINMAGVTLYLGTTMEPRRDLAPEWHVERDITDYANLFMSPQTGEFLLTNYVDATYTGRVFADARLVFYPPGPNAPAADTAQIVISLSEKLTPLTDAEPRLTKSVNLPRNIERLYLDVVAEPQGDDEFWYGCVSDRFVSKESGLCGGGALRETHIFIDDILAGVAPIYPWIYTGGINPYLWFPSPGVQTLNFEPYRVDLTPFAAILNDGRPHTISAQVYGVRRYVFVLGTLMAWRDEGSEFVSGAVTSNTLTKPVVKLDDKGLSVSAVTAKGAVINGPINVDTARDYIISGYVDTSHGRVATQIKQTSRFSNHQTYATDDAQAVWRIKQNTIIKTEVATTDASGTRTHRRDEQFPLSIDYRDLFHTDYSLQDIDLYQSLRRIETDIGPGGRIMTRTQELSYAPKLHALMDPKTRRTKATTGSAVLRVKIGDSEGACYDRTITSRNNTVIAVTDTCPVTP